MQGVAQTVDASAVGLDADRLDRVRAHFDR